MPLVWIPATLGVGLSIAAVYLGSRILSGHPAAPSPAPARTETSVSVAVPPMAVRPSESESQNKPEAPSSNPLSAVDSLPMIDPQPGEQYIQVSALRPEAAQRFISQLREAKLKPYVAPGPSPEVLRVLIGPFADQDALLETKQNLARAGIKNFVRRY